MRKPAFFVREKESEQLIFLIFVISNFGVGGRVIVMIIPVPGHCLPFTFRISNSM